MVMEANYQRDATIALESMADVENLMDELQAASQDGGVLAMIGFSDRRSPLLQVGVHGEVGWISYGSTDPQIAVISQGRERDGDVLYYFQESHTHEIPASAEIPYDDVRKAVTEFFSTGGRQPTNIEWVQDR